MGSFAGSQRGVSLIEALVALLVMSLGMLAIVGVQSTLRMNSDVAKQRSEAVRLAQQAVEDYRSFTQVATPVTAGVPNYSSIPIGTTTSTIDSATGYVNLLGTALPAYGTNTSYTLTSTVTASGDAGDSTDPRFKALQISVAWADRTSTTPNQSVILNAIISRIMPELAGTLAIPAFVDANGVPTRGPYARNPNIPFQATNFGNGTSGYVPPGGGSTGDGTAFLFNNTTALITLCTTSVATNALLTSSAQLTCSAATAWPLSGTIDFATNAAVAGPADAVNPSGTPQGVAVGLTQTFPASGVGAPLCYTSAPITTPAPVPYVTYICAVPAVATSTPASVWSGYSYVTGAGITWAAGGSSVCRYTAGPPAVASRGNLVVPAITNAQHPRAYLNVSAGLSSQNFLVVPYSTGTAADCPDGSPLPSGSTTYPQPSTAP